MDCTVAEHPILKDKYLHSVLRNETEDTSNVEGSLNTEERPAKHTVQQKGNY